MQDGDNNAGPEGGSDPQPTYLVSFTLPEPRTTTTPLDSPPRRVLPIRQPQSDSDHARPHRPPGPVRRPPDLRFVDADRSRLIAQPGSEPNTPSMILTPRAFYPQRGSQVLAHNDGLAVDIAPAQPPLRALSLPIPALSALPDAVLTDPDMPHLESYTPELTHNVPPPHPARPGDASPPDRRDRMIGPFGPGEWYWTRVPRVFDPPDLVDQELALFDLGVAAMKQAFSRSTIYVKAKPGEHAHSSGSSRSGSCERTVADDRGLSYDPPRQSDPHEYGQSAVSAVAAGASTRAQQHGSHRHVANAGDRPVPPPAVRNDWAARPRWTAVAEVPAAAFNAAPRGEPTAHTATGQPRVALTTRCIPCACHGRVCNLAYPCGPCVAAGLACDI